MSDSKLPRSFERVCSALSQRNAQFFMEDVRYMTGTVGPEPITAGSSPGTSETASVTTRAGWAARARR